MDVDVAIEIVDEILVVCEDGGKAELKLGVVGGNELPSLWGNEAGADAFAFIGADRDILKIGVFRAQASGGGDVLGESGVDAAVFIG